MGLFPSSSVLRLRDWLEEVAHGVPGCTLRSRVHRVKTESIFIGVCVFLLSCHSSPPLVSMPWPCAIGWGLWLEFWKLHSTLCSQWCWWYQFTNGKTQRNSQVHSSFLLAPIHSEGWTDSTIRQKKKMRLWGFIAEGNKVIGDHKWNRASIKWMSPISHLFFCKRKIISYISIWSWTQENSKYGRIF